MRKFKVLVIAHPLKRNIVAKYGDPICESQLTGPADELVSAGFLEEVFEDVNDVEVKEEIDSEIEKEEVFEDVKKEIKDIKKPFIKK